MAKRKSSYKGMRRFDLTIKGPFYKEYKLSAYASNDAPGLAIHKKVTWDRDEPRERSGWTVSHMPSGMGLIADYSFPNIADAMEFCRNINGFDWTLPEEELDKEGSRPAVRAAKAAHMNGISVENLSQPDEPPQPEPKRTHHIIRRSEKGTGYEVINTSNDEIVKTFIHRGPAAEFAKKRSTS